MKTYQLPEPVQQLTESFAAFPGIGPKLAQRLSLYVATHGQDASSALQRDLKLLETKIQLCQLCGNLSTSTQCSICSDGDRDRESVMVVESPLDVVQIEQTHAFTGLYVVLGNIISPLNGISPADIRIDLLDQLLKELAVKEIILALPATVEGDATALYISQHIHEQSHEVKVTKLAKGLPTGATLEFLDSDTLYGALQRRVVIEE